MCIYIYVCVYVYIYIYIYMCVYTRIVDACTQLCSVLLLKKEIKMPEGLLCGGCLPLWETNAHRSLR